MRKEEIDGYNIFVIHDFLSPEECEAFVALSEETGYADAPITTAVGFVMRKDVRDNERVMIDDVELAAKLWERAKEFIPTPLWGYRAVGLNERFRYYRYDVGQKFARHYDGAFYRSDDEQSLLTFMVYLNDGFAGGETKFYRGAEKVIVTPERGKALVFVHRQLHEGAPVEAGRKYVLRTDVMYRASPE